MLSSFRWDWRFEWVDASVGDSWRAFARPVSVSERLLIVPAWHHEGSTPSSTPESSERLVLHIEPGATFGLGNHPTTVGCAQALLDVVRPGDSMLDVGTGSGVLAVLAACLGAVEVLGTDLQPACLEVARENAERNGVGSKVSVTLAADRKSTRLNSSHT